MYLYVEKEIQRIRRGRGGGTEARRENERDREIEEVEQEWILKQNIVKNGNIQ